ncbi:MAG TPA: SIMPL domain-containing protein [Candidatus Paceibacterota bacterium]
MKNLNKYFWCAAVTTLVIASLFLLVKIKTELKGYGRNFPASTITVSGEGKVFIKPDIAKISVGVTKNNIDFVKAQKEASEIINKTIKFLKLKGVEEKDIKTTSYNIFPQYDYVRGEQKFKGYEVSQNLEIKIRDLDKVGEILSGVAQSGANMVGSLRFEVDDMDKTKEEARKEAINKAKEKAKTLSKQLGIRFKKIVSFYESDGGFPGPVYFSEAAFGKGGDFSVPTPSVPTGENEIKINVSITYEIR